MGTGIKSVQITASADKYPLEMCPHLFQLSHSLRSLGILVTITIPRSLSSSEWGWAKRRKWLYVLVCLSLRRQSIFKKISPEYSLEGLMLKLKFQYFGHLMRTVDSLENSMMLGKIGGRRRRGRQKMRCLDGITDAMDMNSGLLQAMGLQRVVHDWATEQ